MVPLGALLLFFACSAPAALAQDSPEDPFAHRLEAAAAAENDRALAELIEGRRVDVKPVVISLITQSLQAELSGDVGVADEKGAAAVRIAAAFEERFGERSLSEAAAYPEKWSIAEKHAKRRADSLLARGRELRSGEEALQAYDDALATYRKIGDRIGEAEVLGGLGVVYWFAGEGDSTLAYFHRALEAREAVDDRQLIGNSLNDLGLAARAFLRDNEAALEYFLRSAEVREKIGDTAALVRTNNVISVVYRDLGQPQVAIEYLDMAADQALSVGDSARAASAWQQVGALLSDAGDYTEALSHLERSLELRASDDPERAAALSQIGVVYRRLGDYDAAIEKYQEVIRFAEAAADSALLGGTLTNAGVTLQWAERFETAARYFERSLDIFDRLGEPAWRLDPLINLGSVYLDLEAYDRAEPYLREALDVSRSLNDPLGEGRTLVLLGNLYNLSGREDGGASYYDEGIALARQIGSPELEWAALMGFGERLERRGEYEEAIEFYLQALDNAESLRGGLQLGDDKAKFIAQKRFAYENVIHLLGLLHERQPHSGFERRAFQVAERGKARAFLDLLSESLTSAEMGVDSSLASRRAALLDEMGEAQRSLQLAAASGDAELSDDLRQTLDRLEEDYQRLQREIRRTNPGFSSLSDPEIAGIDAVQEGLLTGDDVLLQYALGDSSSSVWAVSKDEVRMVRLPARDLLQEQVEILRYALAHPDDAPVEAFSAPARRLYELLLEPVADVLEGRDHVTIIPDDVLHYVPFEALLSRDAEEDSFAGLRYLLRTHGVSYGHSASVLLQIAREDGASQHEKQLLAFGDPDFGTLEASSAIASTDLRAGLARLPYSGAEVESIAQIVGRPSADVFVREHADESTLKEPAFLRNYRFLHFATHGIVDERRPDFSGLILSQHESSAEDGFLQAAEIFDLEIAADLVVLSACETGLGEMVRGEGLVGLTRAFMVAGAPSIVVSLWKVADASTSRLMESFYREMIDERRAKSTALQQAKLAMLDNERHAHPFHWAPFVIIGNPK